MHIFLTGATGYIGKRLLPVLVEAGHHVTCCTRSAARLDIPESLAPQVSVFEHDFLEPAPEQKTGQEYDAAYYLIHSMAATTDDFTELERKSAEHFRDFAEANNIKQVIYLSGLIPEGELSKHLDSRRNVAEILEDSSVPLTVLRAGIIVGSGSASFEIIRDLVEKLPVMIAPRWLQTRCQPVAIRNVIDYLVAVLGDERAFDRSFDIGGPDILTYKEMLLRYADVRGLKRYIIQVPVMTPRLSSYWLYFVTSTSYKLAVNLVDSMKLEVIVRDHSAEDLYKIKLLTYREALQLAFKKIEQNMVVSSWKDSRASSMPDERFMDYVSVPTYGCYIDQREMKIPRGRKEEVLDRVWSIGGETGWYYGSTLWKIRGWLDKMAGGVGLRRGRTHPHKIHAGDALDFWRVLAADRQRGKLLLYAEMKLPGEAWLEFKLINREDDYYLQQTATFRPTGVAGRLYWYSVFPFHAFVFKGMLRNIVGS